MSYPVPPPPSTQEIDRFNLGGFWRAAQTVLSWRPQLWVERVQGHLPGFAQKILEHRLVKRGATMLIWRISAMLFTSVGTVWTARCLGPANLGISGFIQTGMIQVMLLIGILPDSFLIRSYKKATTDQERRELVELATTILFSLASAIALIALIAGLVIDIPANWRLAYFCGLPVLIVTALNIAWLMQAKEDQPAQYRAQFYSAIVTTSLSILFLRPGAAAGSDMVLAAIAGIASCGIMWRCAGESQFWNYLRPVKLARAWGVFRASGIVYITGIIIYLYTQFELPLVGYLHSVEELGLYRSAHGLKMTVWTFLSIIPMLLYPRFLEWHKISPQLLYENQWKIFRYMFAGGVALTGAAFLLSPFVYPRIFGAQFAPAAIPFAMLVGSLCIILLNNLFSYGLWSQGKDRAMLGISIVGAVMSLGLNFLIIPKYGMTGAAVVNLIVEGFILGLTIWVTVQNHRRFIIARASVPQVGE
jgi:O-antigen/teichoic acid export membrane protein